MSKPSRLKVGIDVPWVTSWSNEVILGPQPCLTVGGALAIAQKDEAGFGRPNYSENHFPRQRLSVARMLCPMCGGATAPADRWTLTAKRTTAGALRARGLGASVPEGLPNARVVINAGAIAPLHNDCAKRSAVQCPHLSHDPALDLRRFSVKWMVSPLFVEAEDERADAPALPPVVGFLQLCGVTDAVDLRWREKLGV